MKKNDPFAIFFRHSSVLFRIVASLIRCALDIFKQKRSRIQRKNRIRFIFMIKVDEQKFNYLKYSYPNELWSEKKL